MKNNAKGKQVDYNLRNQRIGLEPWNAARILEKETYIFPSFNISDTELM